MIMRSMKGSRSRGSPLSQDYMTSFSIVSGQRSHCGWSGYQPMRCSGSNTRVWSSSFGSRVSDSGIPSCVKLKLLKEFAE